jgi:hypothetical protein
MPLTMRPTRLETSPVYAHLKDYTVFEAGTPIGRIYEQRPPAPPDALISERHAWLLIDFQTGSQAPRAAAADNRNNGILGKPGYNKRPWQQR